MHTIPTDARLAPCPGGSEHSPKMRNAGPVFWVECETCHRESYGVQSADRAAESWLNDAGLPGRSVLIQRLRDAAPIKGGA